MFAKAHESNMSLAFGFEKWHRLCGGYRITTWPFMVDFSIFFPLVSL